MPLAPKMRLGPYEIVSALGAGGMGEVYKARDTRLDRTVAVKICTGHFTDRFEREARAISSLNHPNICALYDVGREEGVDFLVMEHLEGESLEARLRKGPLPMAEALRIAIQIADALDTAHRQGVIHRDLKPGNVMLTPGGAKLLDFGLAKMAEIPGAASGNRSSLPTVAQSLTTEGSILGTFQYMAPEQLEGKEADARSDIFAFGATLYEMLTGRKAFEGPSQASLITAVMSSDPPALSTIQPIVSPALEHVVRRCLAKSPDDRWQTTRDLLGELKWIAEPGSQAGAPGPAVSSRKRLPWLMAGAASLLLLPALIATALHLREQPATAPEIRFQVPVPESLSFRWYDVPEVSPDGEHIAFAAGNGEGESRLFVRDLKSVSATPLARTDTAYSPFWSPDGRQLAFSTTSNLLRADLNGASTVAICAKCSTSPGGTWSRDGVIVISVRGVLNRVPAAGGEPKPLGSLAHGETAQLWPQFLPDGQHYLYLSLNPRPDLQGIYVAALGSNDRKRIVASDTNAAYSASGHLLFLRGNVLMAQPFDAKKLELRAEPHPVAHEMFIMPFLAGASFSVSPNGVLVWRAGDAIANSELTWIDRKGNKLGVVGVPADFSSPALSPDERKVAVGIRDPKTKMRDIWVADLLRGATTRLTFDAADDLNPVWSPDGTRIAFTSDRKGERDIYQKLSDGSGPDELLLEGRDGQKNLEDWSPDGKYLLYNHQPAGHLYLLVMPLTGDRKPVPYLKTEFRTDQAQFSPNGRWVAYRSDESGKNEVYVQGFSLDPSHPRGKWQISTAGGEEPQWRRDGRELFYVAGNKLMAVDVKTDGQSFEAGIPKRLFDVRMPSRVRNRYVVSKDGQRFLVNLPLEEASKAPIEVLVNWR